MIFFFFLQHNWQHSGAMPGSTLFVILMLLGGGCGTEDKDQFINMQIMYSIHLSYFSSPFHFTPKLPHI